MSEESGEQCEGGQREKGNRGGESEGGERRGGKDMSGVAPPGVENVVVRDFLIPLISGGIAVVKIPVPMSEPDFTQLTATLQAWKAALVRPTV